METRVDSRGPGVPVNVWSIGEGVSKKGTGQKGTGAVCTVGRAGNAPSRTSFCRDVRNKAVGQEEADAIFRWRTQ